MVTATFGGENLVKISKKMAGKLRGFLKKVKDGVTTVPYVPGAIFELAKEYKVKKKEGSKEVDKKKSSKDKKSENSFSKRVEEVVKRHVEEEEKKRKAVQNKDKKEKADNKENKKDLEQKNIKGKTLAEFVQEKNKKDMKDIDETKEIPSKKEDKESNVVKPVVMAVPEKDIKQPKKEKKNLEDLTEFATYKDYKYAYFWNYKINKYDADVLDSVAKDLAKVADVNQFRTLLTEAQFNDKRAKQVKAKEISEIKKKHKEEMTQAEQKRQADVQAAIDERQKEVDSLNEKLETARSKNRTLNSKLKVTTESLAQIQEKADLVGIQAISDIINEANTKCENIDKKAQEKAEAKKQADSKDDSDKTLNKEVDERVKKIHENISKENMVGLTKEDKATLEDMMADIHKGDPHSQKHIDDHKSNQPKETPAPKEEKSSEPTPIVKDENSNSLVNELSSYDDSYTPVSSSIFDTPADNSTEFNDMGFDPEERAEIGQEAFKRMTDSNNSLTWQEALEQVAAEHREKEEKSKGRTR